MRTKLLFAFIGMIAGLCLGFTASWVYFDRSSVAIAKNITLLTTEEHIQHAKLLRQGKNSIVLDQLENTLLISVQWLAAYHKLFPRDNDFLRYLWKIREYYEDQGITIPESIQPTLLSLAPKPPRPESTFQCPPRKLNDSSE